MRFREYESIPTASSRQSHHQPCVEYHLSVATNSDGGSNGGTKDRKSTELVWSVPKSKPASDDAATNDSHTGNQNETGGGTSIIQSAKIQIIHTTNKLNKLSRDLFLPIDYPSSVAEGYIEYQFYDSLQGLCSYLRGVVSTSAVLSATGVGDAEATAMSAAMTWAVRDGLGMIGGLLFSYMASPHFDAHVKEFRLLADVLNDIAMTLDMALPLLLAHSWVTSPPPIFTILSPYLPSAYLVLTSISTLCKVSCGMAAGATKGNITDHFAISGNRADCQSKESTQETLVSLVGMCCGVWLANILHRLERETGDDSEVCMNDDVGEEEGVCARSNADDTMTFAQMISWSIFILLTVIHVWANYVGMQILRLRTLNRERAKVALQPLVEHCSQWLLEGSKEDGKQIFQLSIEKLSDNILTPTSVSESLWKSMVGMVRPGCIHLGMSLKDLVRWTSSSSRGNTACNFIKGQWDHEKYIIFIDGYDSEDDTGKTRNNNNLHSIIVMLRVGANDHDELKAFLHAHILNFRMQKEHTKLPHLLSRSYEIIQHLFPSSIGDATPDQAKSDSRIDLFQILGEKGWDMKRLYLGFGPWRCEWDEVDD